MNKLVLPEWIRDAPKGFWKDKRNQRRYLSWVAEELGIKTQNEWYKVSVEKIQNLGGSGVLRQYNFSLRDALSSVYHEHKWIPWKFSSVPRGFWDNKQNKRMFFDWAANELQLQTPEGWYKVQPSTLKGLASNSLTKSLTHAALARLLGDLYPEYDLDQAKFAKSVEAPSQKNMDSVAQLVGVKSPEDWYSVTIPFDHAEVKAILNRHDGSLYKALCESYPNYNWLPWKLPQMPRGWWDNKKNQRTFMNWLGEQLGIRDHSDWYKVTNQQVQQHNAQYLIQHYYRNSLPLALVSIYPEHPWLMWRFNRVPEGFWNDIVNQRAYIEWLGKELNVSKLEDWYKVKHRDIRQIGSTGMLQVCYGNSLPAALKAIYPQFDWKPWRFTQVPKGYWNDDNTKNFLTSIANDLKLETDTDWATVSYKWLQLNKGGTLLNKNKGLDALIQKHIPLLTVKHKYSKMISKWQMTLYKILHNVWPTENIVLEYTRPDLMFANSKRLIRFDIYIPSFNIAFEYQGIQHFQSRHPNDPRPHQQQKRDAEKRARCDEFGITLIEIPYWWDGKQESLLATIYNHRPDIVTDPGRSKPIPTTPERHAIIRDNAVSTLMPASRWIVEV